MHAGIFNMLSSSKNIEKDSSASGLSKLVLKAEGAPITYEDATQGYDTTYTHLTRALGSSISKEMYDDDQYGIMQRRPRDLARAKVRTLEKVGADIFNYGFTVGGGGDASFTAGDAVALFSASHPRTDGGTVQGNTVTTDFNESSLETAIVTMRATLDDKGQLEMISPNTLLIPPAMEKEARILLESSGRVGTANNDVNPYQGRLTIKVWDYLGSAAGGSDTAWFLLDSSRHALNWFTREDAGVEGPEYDFDTKTAKWSIMLRSSVGFSGWRGVYGSKGDNS